MRNVTGKTNSYFSNDVKMQKALSFFHIDFKVNWGAELLK